MKHICPRSLSCIYFNKRFRFNFADGVERMWVGLVSLLPPPISHLTPHSFFFHFPTAPFSCQDWQTVTAVTSLEETRGVYSNRGVGLFI